MRLETLARCRVELEGQKVEPDTLAGVASWGLQLMPIKQKHVFSEE